MNFLVSSSLVALTWGAYHFGVCRHSTLENLGSLASACLNLSAWPVTHILSVWTRLFIPSRLFLPRYKEAALLLQELESGARWTHWVLLAPHGKYQRKVTASQDLHYLWPIYSGTFLTFRLPWAWHQGHINLRGRVRWNRFLISLVRKGPQDQYRKKHDRIREFLCRLFTLANGRAEWSLFFSVGGSRDRREEFFSAENFTRQKRCISSDGSGKR